MNKYNITGNYYWQNLNIVNNPNAAYHPVEGMKMLGMPTNFSVKQMSICIAFDRQQLAFGDDCTDSTGTEQTLASCISSCASMIDKYIF